MMNEWIGNTILVIVVGTGLVAGFWAIYKRKKLEEGEYNGHKKL